MRIPRIWVALPLVLGSVPALGGGTAPAIRAGPEPAAAALCDVLARVDAGEREPVVVSGVYVASFHDARFYDPEEPLCSVDVQPSTAVEFAPGLVRDPTFDRLVERDGRALVTFAGVLEGPRPLGPDDPALPPLIATMSRLNGVRYGGMPSYRTRLVVERILRASPVRRDVRRGGAERASQPVLLHGRLPGYPDAARRAGITGVVVVEVRVEGGRVAATQALSGDRLLAAEAVADIESWELAPATSAQFTTTFSFELEKRLTGSDPNPRLELRLPSYARIVGAADGW
jgi:TonB family protein